MVRELCILASSWLKVANHVPLQQRPSLWSIACFGAMTILSSGTLLRPDLMMLMVPLFEALGHDLTRLKAQAPGKLEIAHDALMTAARCARALPVQDVLQAVAIALQCLKAMLEGLDVDTGMFTQWTEVSWRQFAPQMPLPRSSVTDRELFLEVAGSANSATLMMNLQKSRQASEFMGVIAHCFLPASDPAPAQEAFQQAREILDQQDKQWKKVIADVLCVGQAGKAGWGGCACCKIAGIS